MLCRQHDAFGAICIERKRSQGNGAICIEGKQSQGSPMLNKNPMNTLSWRCFRGSIPSRRDTTLLLPPLISTRWIKFYLAYAKKKKTKVDSEPIENCSRFRKLLRFINNIYPTCLLTNLIEIGSLNVGSFHKGFINGKQLLLLKKTIFNVLKRELIINKPDLPLIVLLSLCRKFAVSHLGLFPA